MGAAVDTDTHGDEKSNDFRRRDAKSFGLDERIDDKSGHEQHEDNKNSEVVFDMDHGIGWPGSAHIFSVVITPARLVATPRAGTARPAIELSVRSLHRYRQVPGIVIIYGLPICHEAR